MSAFMLKTIAILAMLTLPGLAQAQVVNANPNASERHDDPPDTGAGVRINTNPNTSATATSDDGLSGSATGTGGTVTRNTTDTGPRVQAPTQSSERQRFVEANIISVFYHELGHAVIDIEEVPIFAQEEDAADVFAIYLIDALFEDDSALSLAYDTAFGMLAEAKHREGNGNDVIWWDTHGADQQRFYNTVCIFYGADPKGREGFAHDLGLPEQRAAFCPGEFAQADASWGSVLSQVTGRGGGNSLRFHGERSSLAAKILINEIAQLNEVLRLSKPLDITVEDCGEPNAFFIPSETRVIFCSEFEPHLRRLAGRVY